MESKELESLMNQYLFVPIPDKLAEQLHDVVDNLIPEMTSELVTKYAKAVFRNQADLTFMNNYQTMYKKLYGVALKMPRVAYVILMGFALSQTLQSDVVDAELKTKFSLIIRNCAVTRKGHWDGIICSKWLIEIYGYYEEYSKKMVICNVDSDNLLRAVMPNSQWEGTGLAITDKAVYDQIRSLCVSEVMANLDKYVASSEFGSIYSPFVKAYLLVRRMVEWNWKYISESPVGKLRKALGENAKKRKQLGKIISDMAAGVAKEQIVKANEGSSLLLARMSEGQDLILDECMFSALEFGVYLYYELLLETFNS